MEDSFNDEKLVIAVKELKDMLINKTTMNVNEKDKAKTLFPIVDECDFESDLELAFFVVGWKYDLNKAIETIGKSRELRNSSEKLRVARRNIRSGKIVNIEDFPHRDDVNKYWEHDQTHTGVFTKDNMPVAICRVGEVDLYGMQDNVPVEDFQEYMIYVFEYRLFMLENIMKKQTKNNNNNNKEEQQQNNSLPRFVDIHCLNCPRGFLSTFSYSNIQYFRWWMGVLGPAYPEQCSHVILVNTPWVFYGGWGITKGWLPTRTVEKIEILGSDVETWRAESSSLISKIGKECVDNCIKYLAREQMDDKNEKEDNNDDKKKKEKM